MTPLYYRVLIAVDSGTGNDDSPFPTRMFPRRFNFFFYFANYFVFIVIYLELFIANILS